MIDFKKYGNEFIGSDEKRPTEASPIPNTNAEVMTSAFVILFLSLIENVLACSLLRCEAFFKVALTFVYKCPVAFEAR